MEDLAPVFDQILPWLGGGAVTAIASFTAWVWITYFKRTDSQWNRSDQLIDDIKAERDHWRNQAQSRNGEVIALQELTSELRKNIDELERQNALLATQNDILAEEKGALEDKVERLYGDIEALKARLYTVEEHSEANEVP